MSGSDTVVGLGHAILVQMDHQRILLPLLLHATVHQHHRAGNRQLFPGELKIHSCVSKLFALGLENFSVQEVLLTALKFVIHFS